MEIDYDFVKQYGVAKGNTGKGVTFSTFTLDKHDMANLVRLGNKARAVKGFGPLRYQTNVVQNNRSGHQRHLLRALLVTKSPLAVSSPTPTSTPIPTTHRLLSTAP